MDNQSQKRELMSRLTEEQRQELKYTVAEMKDAGVSQEEIRTVVKKMLKKWGITLEAPEQSESKK
jgi:DNA-binding transcriptional regulator YhcF (GntR family)